MNATEEKRSSTVAADPARSITLTRLFDAPPELVFEAWTDPEHVGEWWGPAGFTITTKEMSVKPGGVWRYTMHGPDGTDYPNRTEFIEVVRPERLVYYQGWDRDSDEERHHVTVTFENRNGKTQLTLTTVFRTAEELEKVVREHGAIEGGKQHLEKLAEYLKKMG